MFESQAESSYKALPTFVKYCKEHPFEAEKGIKVVNLIWLPNQYKSITFETERFRLRITDRSNFYPELLREVEQWEAESACVGIQVTSAKLKAYRLFRLEGETCSWEQVGEFGRRLTVQDKQSRKKKREVQNPYSLTSERPGAQLELPLEGP